MKRRFVEIVYYEKKCCSCGICIGICHKEAISYSYDKYGFLKPKVDMNRCIGCNACVNNCPGNSYFKNDLIYDFTGKKMFYGYSNNEELRKSASSGGIVSEILRYLIDSSRVDYCVTVGNDENGNPCAVVSNDVEQIIKSKTSKYCPVEYGNFMKQINPSKYRYAIVALPCQIQSLKRVYKRYRKNFIYIALICNHVPSKNWTSYMYNCFPENECVGTTYRGDGWPGNITLHGKRDVKVPYRKTFRLFGKYYYNWRCKICNDHFGSFSDIAVGDAYFLSDNSYGNSICIVFNELFNELFINMANEKYITITEQRETYEFFKSAKTLIRRGKILPDMLEVGKKLKYSEPEGLTARSCCIHISIGEKKKAVIDEILNRIISKNGIMASRILKKLKDELIRLKQ